MKKILLAATAATALVGVATPAAAQTNERHYNVAGVQLTNPTGVLGAIAEAGANTSILLGIGTRYTAFADAPSDRGDIGNVSVQFNLTGTVNRDCSFYSGNSAGNVRNIDFGVIGIRGGNNENVSDAFEMVGAATADIDTLTAGCNFNNTIKIAKSSAQGLVNNAASGYDSDQFQANIRYQVEARWRGIAENQVGPGSNKNLAVSYGQLEDEIRQGAWRSAMAIDIRTEVPNKGLVAGTYSGSTTLTLSVL